MKITIDSENESKLAEWLAKRGGIAVWRNCDLGSPDIGSETYTPATQADGSPVTPPHWRNGNTPAAIVTDPADVTVQTYAETARVKIRRGPPYLGGVHRADRKRLDAALEKAGPGACYVEDFSRMQYGSAWFDAVIMKPTETRPLRLETMACDQH